MMNLMGTEADAEEKKNYYQLQDDYCAVLP